MNLFKNKTRIPEPENDCVARFIAGQIISWQMRTSDRLNRWINGYSRKRQRLVLILSGVLATGALIISLIPDTWQAPLRVNESYIPRHVGEPSETIRLKDPTPKTTDSSTNKK